MSGQPLRGLVGQDMSGRRAKRQGYCRVYRPGSHTFTVPYSGRYKFVLHGPGGACDGSADGGGSGAYCERTIPLNAGQQVAIVVGTGTSGTDTRVTAPGYVAMVAGAAVAEVAGAASGGDVMYAGSTGGIAGADGSAGLGTAPGTAGSGGAQGGGAAAPGTTEFPGGDGGDYNVTTTQMLTPGGGQAANSSGSAGPAGDGRCVVFLESF